MHTHCMHQTTMHSYICETLRLMTVCVSKQNPTRQISPPRVALGSTRPASRLSVVWTPAILMPFHSINGSDVSRTISLNRESVCINCVVLARSSHKATQLPRRFTEQASLYSAEPSHYLSTQDVLPKHYMLFFMRIYCQAQTQTQTSLYTTHACT